MKPLHGVIFDYGNTLVRLDPTLRSARTDYADVVAGPGAERLASFLRGPCSELDPRFVERFLEIRERNRGIAEEQCREIPAVESLRETLRALGHAALDEAMLARAIEAFFLEEIECIRPMPGAAETLRACKARGIPVAMLSNATSGAYVVEVVSRMGWGRIFRPLVVSADLGIRKPRPEAFHAVLERWKLPPEGVVMVGDSLYHDVKGAQEVGLRTVHLKAIPNPFDAAWRESVRPDLTVATHPALLEALLS